LVVARREPRYERDGEDKDFLHVIIVYSVTVAKV
jgi:hypothetical protein